LNDDDDDDDDDAMVLCSSFWGCQVCISAPYPKHDILVVVGW